MTKRHGGRPSRRPISSARMSLLIKFAVQQNRGRHDIFAKWLWRCSDVGNEVVVETVGLGNCARFCVGFGNGARFGGGFGIGECCGVGCIGERFRVRFGINFGVGRKVTVGGEAWNGNGAGDGGCGLSSGRVASGGGGGGGGIPMSR